MGTRLERSLVVGLLAALCLGMAIAFTDFNPLAANRRVDYPPAELLQAAHRGDSTRPATRSTGER